MARFQQLLVSLLCALALSAAFAARSADPASGETQRAALDAAYKRLSAGRYLSQDDVVVIRQARGFTVVSFLRPCSITGKCRGGRMHVVYDPRLSKIVYVLGED
jgi:hypothetical protein